MDGQGREAKVIAAFSSAADILTKDFDALDLLHTLITDCTEILELAAGGILLAPGSAARAGAGALEFATATSAAAERVAHVTLSRGAGPCIDCYIAGTPIVMGDLNTYEALWPEYCAATRAEGFESVLVIPMRVRGEVIGAMDLFGKTHRDFPEADMKVAQALASVATIAILQDRVANQAQVVEAQLKHALESRIVIEQAKGVIATSLSVDMDEAFRLLRVYARNNNLRIHGVAEQVAAGDLLPVTLTLAKVRA